MSRNQEQQQQQAGTAHKAGGQSRAEQGPLFTTGQLIATPAALELLASVPTGALPLLRRHVAGDFGDVCASDKALNLRAIKHGSRVVSSYKFAVGVVLVITEADRSATTVLLPSDY